MGSRTVMPLNGRARSGSWTVTAGPDRPGTATSVALDTPEQVAAWVAAELARWRPCEVTGPDGRTWLLERPADLERLRPLWLPDTLEGTRHDRTDD